MNLSTKKVFVVIAILGAAVFFNSLFNNFVLDDLGQITANPAIHSLTKIPSLFFGHFGGQEASSYYRPLVYSFYSILYSLFQNSTFPYHLLQLFFHIANSFLIFLIFKKFLRRGIAFFLALLFLVHPINEETVAYIANLQDVLFLFFGLLSFYFLQKDSDNSRHVIYANVLLLPALLSKETAILFFITNFLYVYLFNKAKLRLYSIYSLSVVAVYAFLRLASRIPFHKQALVPIMTLPFWERMINAPAIIFYYVKTLFFPKDLASLHSWVVARPQFGNFYLPLFLVLLFFTGIFFAAYFIYKKSGNKKLVMFLLIWFALGILLHLQIVPIDTTVSDRYFYFPFVGLLALLGLFLQSLRVNRPFKIIGVSLGIILLATFSLRTIVRNENWKNQTVLLAHDAVVSSDDYLLELLYGADLLKNGKTEEALPHIQKSVELYPKSSYAWTTLGAYYYIKGDIERARETLQRAMSIGDYYGAYENMAKIKYEHGPLPEAKDFVIKATKLYPNSKKLWFYRFLIGYKMSDYDEQLLSSRSCYLVDGDAQCYAVYNQLRLKLPILLQE